MKLFETDLAKIKLYQWIIGFILAIVIILCGAYKAKQDFKKLKEREVMKVIVSERAIDSKVDEIFVIEPSYADQVVEQLKDDSRQDIEVRSEDGDLIFYSPNKDDIIAVSDYYE